MDFLKVFLLNTGIKNYTVLSLKNLLAIELDLSDQDQHFKNSRLIVHCIFF